MNAFRQFFVRCLPILAGLAAMGAGAAPIGAQETTTVILVRHAEQLETEGDRDPSLSEVGQARAAALVHVLEGVELQAIHSTPLKRTLETAAPVAELFGLEIITTEPTATFAGDMAHKLTNDHPGQTVLVVSHSNTVPAIINELGGGPFEQLEHEEFDSIFVVHLRSGEPAQVTRLQYGVPTP